jgi:hypothetical protein
MKEEFRVMVNNLSTARIAQSLRNNDTEELCGFVSKE